MDHELIKKILLNLEESETAYTKLKTVAENLGLNFDDAPDEAFVYNCELIANKKLIIDENGTYKIGRKFGEPSKIIFFPIGFRLTAEGHEYLSAIKKPAIWEKTKKIAGDAGLGTMIEAAKIVVSEAIKNAIT